MVTVNTVILTSREHAVAGCLPGDCEEYIQAGAYCMHLARRSSPESATSLLCARIQTRTLIMPMQLPSSSTSVKHTKFCCDIMRGPIEVSHHTAAMATTATTMTIILTIMTLILTILIFTCQFNILIAMRLLIPLVVLCIQKCSKAISASADGVSKHSYMQYI